MHVSVFSSSLYLPAAQGSHTRLFRRVPGLHAPQYPGDAPPQLLRGVLPGHGTASHGMQWSILDAFEKLCMDSPPAHGRQLRSRVDVGKAATDVPGVQSVCFVQKLVPSLAW